MSNLKTDLARIADAGVEGIGLEPLRVPRAPRRSHRVVAVVAAVCVMVAAVAVAAMVRADNGRHQRITLGFSPGAFRSFAVPSAGMSPTLHVGDTVVAATSFGVIVRGDVVRLRFPKASAISTPAGGDAGFKRVIGLPGDTIEGHGGDVFVNGRKLAEPYADHITTDFAPVAVPQGSYFVMGDNRQNSRDSRHYGPVRRADILAVALRITAPADHVGRIAGSPRR